MLQFNKNSLRNRLLLGVFLASIIPYVIGGAYILDIVVDRAQKEYIQEAQKVIDGVEQRLDKGLLEPAEALVTLLSQDERVEAVGRYDLNDYTRFSSDGFVRQSLSSEARISRFFDTARHNYIFADSVFLGTIWGGYMESPRFTPNTSYDPRVRPWFYEAMDNKGKVYITNPYITTITNKMVISAARTVEQGSQFTGVVGVMIRLTEFQEEVSSVKIGQTGCIMVLNPQNKIVVSPWHPEWLLRTPQEIQVGALMELEKKGGQLVSFTVDKKDQLMLVSHPDKRGWKVVAIFDREEMEAAIVSIRNSIIGVYAVTLLLILLTVTYASTRITRPLQMMTEAAGQMAQGNLETTSIPVHTGDELGQLAKSFSMMARNLKNSYEELEAKVEIRTQELTATNEELLSVNDELKNTLTRLQEAQSQLIQSEKMAALGGLVAGVAHEINTPVGVAVTAASHLEYLCKEFSRLYEEGNLKRQDLTEFMESVNEAMKIIMVNLRRAADLIRSFKQVSVDQTSEARRSFKVKEYLEEILMSLSSKLKKTKHKIEILCDGDLELDGFPGVFAQVVTNLVMNSLHHAFDPNEEGTITISAGKKDNRFILVYEDNGRGMSPPVRERIFEPFFTTNRGRGGTGLGLYILYNIVTQQFGGTVECESAVEEGVKFTITFPLEAKKNENV